MKCPRCKATNQENFRCSNCDNVLKEQCPECGDWEPIGRPVCFRKVKRIERAEEKVKKEAPNSLNWFVRMMSSRRGEGATVVLFLVLLLSAQAAMLFRIFATETLKQLLLCTLGVMSLIFVLHIWCGRGRKKCCQHAEDEFWRTHTEEEMLIKQHRRWLSHQL